MNVPIELLPQGTVLHVPRGAGIEDVLFTQGVEFPCGGRGRCKGCRIKVLEGTLPITDDDERLLSATDLAAGWRLACRAKAESPLRIELAQWESTILSDDAAFVFEPQEGLGVAVDIGTTTLVAQLLDLTSGNVLGVRTALNSQARHGADVMSRIDFAISGSQSILQRCIREQLGQLIYSLLAEAPGPARPLRAVVLVGNTVMHHLFSGISVAPLAQYPFLPENDGLQRFGLAELGWTLPPLIARATADAGEGTVRFLPCLGGFVGSDLLAGILATRLHEDPALTCLLDLGTNGEIIVGNRDRILCTSTAAGPAFEGARISMGMRAATGAISEVHAQNGELSCRVLGQGPARGICGSGLVDAVAVGLETGRIQPSGRFAQGTHLPLQPPVSLNQRDIRELQLAKGAIAAGLKILLRSWGAQVGDLSRVYLAGAFGNYISRASARRIGLLDFPAEIVEPAGNTALRGAKVALVQPQGAADDYRALRQKITPVALDQDPLFQDTFVDEMLFPG